MGASRRKTTLAILRSTIGIKDIAFAEILGCSKATINSLESGRLKMSDSMAERVRYQTGVSLHWLLANDLSAPPLAKDGKLYTIQTFQEAQADRLADRELPWLYVVLDAAGLYARLRATLDHARDKDEYHVTLFKLTQAFDEVAAEIKLQEDRAPLQPLTGADADKGYAVMKEDIERLEMIMSPPEEKFLPGSNRHRMGTDFC